MLPSQCNVKTTEDVVENSSALVGTIFDDFALFSGEIAKEGISLLTARAVKAEDNTDNNHELLSVNIE